MFCKNCGVELKIESKFCPQCGINVTKNKAEENVIDDKEIIQNKTTTSNRDNKKLCL